MPKPTYFQPPKYNHEGRERLWLDGCLLTHDSWCGCDTPFIHLLNCMVPPGHKDRDFTIEELINREAKQCHSGGIAAIAGDPTTDLPTEREENTIENLENVFSDDAIDELLAAAAADVEPR